MAAFYESNITISRDGVLTAPGLGAAAVVAVRPVLVRELGQTDPPVGLDVGAVPREDSIDVVVRLAGVLITSL